jgi:hypothetical protein
MTTTNETNGQGARVLAALAGKIAAEKRAAAPVNPELADHYAKIRAELEASARARYAAAAARVCEWCHVAPATVAAFLPFDASGETADVCGPCAAKIAAEDEAHEGGGS